MFFGGHWKHILKTGKVLYHMYQPLRLMTQWKTRSSFASWGLKLHTGEKVLLASCKDAKHYSLKTGHFLVKFMLWSVLGTISYEHLQHVNSHPGTFLFVQQRGLKSQTNELVLVCCTVNRFVAIESNRHRIAGPPRMFPGPLVDLRPMRPILPWITTDWLQGQLIIVGHYLVNFVIPQIGSIDGKQIVGFIKLWIQDFMRHKALIQRWVKANGFSEQDATFQKTSVGQWMKKNYHNPANISNNFGCLWESLSNSWGASASFKTSSLLTLRRPDR